MTNTELNAFRMDLDRQQVEIVGGSREALVIESSPDELDRIQHASERDYAISNLERKSKRLREIQDALSRIDAGTFGVCVECGTNIKPKRLAAVPWAMACVACQEALDRAQAAPDYDLERSSAMAA